MDGIATYQENSVSSRAMQSIALHFDFLPPHEQKRLEWFVADMHPHLKAEVQRSKRWLRAFVETAGSGEVETAYKVLGDLKPAPRHP